MIGIEKYEIKNENIYYYIKKGLKAHFHLFKKNSVDENDICISLILRPLTDVVDTKPAMVEAQDYYEPSLRASSSYEILCRDETWTSDLLDESSSMKSGFHWNRMSDNRMQSVDSDKSKIALHGNGVIVQNFAWTGK